MSFVGSATCFEPNHEPEDEVSALLAESGGGHLDLTTLVDIDIAALEA